MQEIIELKEQVLSILDKLINNGITEITGLYGHITISLINIRKNMLSVETSTMNPTLLKSILSDMKEKLESYYENQIQNNERPERSIRSNDSGGNS